MRARVISAQAVFTPILLLLIRCLKSNLYNNGFCVVVEGFTAVTQLTSAIGRIHIFDKKEESNDRDDFFRQPKQQWRPPRTILLLSSSSRSIAKARSPWILLVDDEESIRVAVGRFFIEKGYKVTTCENGSKAMELLLISPRGGEAETASTLSNVSSLNFSLPDCIISDVRMPVMDGIELLRKIRKLQQNETDYTHDRKFNQLQQQRRLLKLSVVPFILLSAKGLVIDRMGGYDAGADGYLTKPFSPDELVAIVDSVVQRSQKVINENIKSNINDRNGIDSSADTNRIIIVDDDDERTTADIVRELNHELDDIQNMLANGLDRRIGGRTLKKIVGNGWVEQTDVFLSKDERYILELVSTGMITKEIAIETHLSTRRIEQILTEMYRKTSTRNRTQLVRWAISTGNVD